MHERPEKSRPGSNLTEEELEDLFAEYGRFLPVIAMEYCPDARLWLIECFCDGIREYAQFARVGRAVYDDMPVSFAIMLTVHLQKHFNFN